MSALSQPVSWSASARIGIAPKSPESCMLRAMATAVEVRHAGWNVGGAEGIAMHIVEKGAQRGLPDKT